MGHMGAESSRRPCKPSCPLHPQLSRPRASQVGALETRGPNPCPTFMCMCMYMYMCVYVSIYLSDPCMYVSLYLDNDKQPRKAVIQNSIHVKQPRHGPSPAVPARYTVLNDRHRHKWSDQDRRSRDCHQAQDLGPSRADTPGRRESQEHCLGEASPRQSG